MWSCTVLTYLERVFDSPHPEELLPSLELICTAIRQARVQPADKNRTGQDQSGLEKHNSIILFVDKAFEKSLLSWIPSPSLSCHFDTTIQPQKSLVST